MITVIRRKLIQNKAYKGLVWAIGIVLAVSLELPGVVSNRFGQPWVISVNGFELAQQDYMRKVIEQENHIQLFRQQYGAYADALAQAMGLTLDPYALALNSFVREELLNQTARTLGIQVHQDYLYETLADSSFIQQHFADLVPAHVVDPTHGIHAVKLRSHLQRLQLSMVDFEGMIAQSLKRYLVKNMVLASSYVPDMEKQERFMREYGRKKYSVFTFSLAQEIEREKAKGVSTQEIQKFFEGHKDHYYIPEKRAAMRWKLDASTYGITVPDAEVEKYYKDHQAEFVATPAKVHVRRILLKIDNPQQVQAVEAQAQELQRQLVQNPAHFEQKARDLSSDSATAAQGGLMPAFARGTHDQIFERAAFLLAKDGDVSGVFKTQEGINIIQRVSKTMPTYKQLSQVAAEIRQKIKDRLFTMQCERDVQRYKDAASEAEFKQFVADKKALSSVLAMAPQDSSLASKALYGISKVGDRALYWDNGAAYVIQMTHLEKRHLPAFDALRAGVEKDFYQMRAESSLQERLEKLKALLASQKLQEIAELKQAVVEHMEITKPQDQGAMAELKKKGLPGSIATMTQPNSALVHQNKLIVLTHIEEPQALLSAEQRAELMGNLKEERNGLALGGFVASLSRTATIKRNESILHQQKEYSI